MKKFLKWGGIALVVIIILAALTESDDSNNQGSNSNSNNTSQETSVAQEPMVIEANTLADAFDANQVAAESEWQGKYVQFTAEVSNITDTGVSFYNVGSKEFSMTQISCKVKDKQQLLSLTNGQMATVKGTVDKQTIGVIGVNNCEVVK